MADGDVTWGDNVIYADFGGRSGADGRGSRGARGDGGRGDRGSRGRRGPKESRGRRQAGAKSARPRTNLARRLYDSVAELVDDGRLARGESYYRDGNVLGFRMVDGQIVGEVKGSQLEPFTVVIKLPYRDAGVADGVLEWLAGTDGAADDLDRGRLPEGRMDELLVAPDENPGCRCSCPDPAPACKHAVAVAAAAARTIDDEPMNALELRGIGAHEARHRLATMKAEAAARAAGRTMNGERRGPVRRRTGADAGDSVLELVERDFWGADLPAIEVPSPEIMVALRDTDPTLLHAALRPTTVLSVETLRAVADLEDCWDHLVSPPSFDDVDLDDDSSGPRAGDEGMFVASFDDD